jgi:hypothetical protein
LYFARFWSVHIEDLSSNHDGHQRITSDSSESRSLRTDTKAGPGSIVFIPRNVMHRFKNVGSVTGRMLGWSLPGGQDHYLKAISELAAGGGFTSEKVMEISKAFDTHFSVEP